MINFATLLPEWSWEGCIALMERTKTTRLECVPSMLFGLDWDHRVSERVSDSDQLSRLLSIYQIPSIQSLTYGLDINLAEPLEGNPDVQRRFSGLAELGRQTGCNVFVLGSPGQKKLRQGLDDKETHRILFQQNCDYLASLLAPTSYLSLEHNTHVQGAEFCNTLGQIADVVVALRESGRPNIGINLDTKCLIHEFGESIPMAKLFSRYKLHELVTSIQVSLDFLNSSATIMTDNLSFLADLALEKSVPISLEEFGIQNDQLDQFIHQWQLASAPFSR